MRIVYMIFLGFIVNSYTLAQSLGHNEKDNKYIPRNLPEVVLTKVESKKRKPNPNVAMYSGLKYSISTDPFFGIVLLGPYIKFDYSFANLSVFAAFGFSSPGGLLYQGDATTYFLPLNYFALLQEEVFLAKMFTQDITNTHTSFAFESGITFGGLPEIMSEKSLSLFIRYSQSGGYGENIIENWNGFFTTTTVIPIYYSAQLFELVGVIQKPWGQLFISSGNALLYFTTDYGLGLGMLKVTRDEAGSTYVNETFLIDTILRFYMGISF